MDGNEMERQLDASDALFRDVTNFIVFNQIAGDYLEFGVYQGDALCRIYEWLNTHWKEYKAIPINQGGGRKRDAQFLKRKRYFAFDSFKGLPESNSTSTPSHFKKGAYSATKREFLSNLKEHGVELSQVVPVPGWFDDTLTPDTKKKLSVDKAALIFIDCDLYESALPIFAFLTGLVQDGTTIIMDDFFRYKGHPQRGVQGAFNEWRAKNPQIHTAELARCCANRVAFVCSIL